VYRPSRIVAGLALAASFALVALTGCGGSSLPGGVAAQVGSQDIAQSEIDQAIGQQKAAAEQQGQTFPEAGSEEYTALQRQVLEGLVFQRIVSLEAKECGKPCLATPKQLAAERTKIIKDNFSGDAKKFDEFLAEQGLTQADVERILRSGIEEPKVTARVTKGIRFTPAQALAYCRKNPQEFKEPASRKASHILVKTKAQAESVRAQATTGNFASLAGQYSTDPGSKAQGGDLGVVQKGALVPEFEKVALSLKDGEISQPVKTQFGYHIITVRITPARQIPCAEAEKQIIQTQTSVRKNEAVQKWRAEVTEKWAPKTTYADSALEPQPASTTGS
jgi:parvulin-like peptidyl-prolyl isomerase